jgi:nucleotide-binding universal stress UspA family protein
MYRRILVPLDGSVLAEQVLPLAKDFAARFKAAIALFQAVSPIRRPQRAGAEVYQAGEQLELLRGQAREYLETIRKDFTAASIAATSEVRTAAPAAAILEYAESEGMDLIAMATHGRTGVGRWVYGSVADKVLHGARVPLLLVRVSDEPPAPRPLTRILVPLDGSALAENALEPARQVAAAFDADLLLLRVWNFPFVGYEVPVSVLDEWERDERAAAQDYLTLVTDQLQAQGLRGRGETQGGAVAEAILAVAQNADASMIVMCTHGRSGVGRWVMGSVADRVLRAAPMPVLLVRPSLPTAQLSNA